MGIISWVILGGIAGWLASLIMKQKSGLIWNIILGVVGGLLGGYGASFLGWDGVSGFNLYSLIVAVVGAIIVIYVGRLFRVKEN